MLAVRLLLLLLLAPPIASAFVPVKEGDTGYTLWANQQDIVVQFLDGNRTDQKTVQTYASEWTRYANLQFIFVDKNGRRLPDLVDERPDLAPLPKSRSNKTEFPVSDIRITFNEGSNSSLLGVPQQDYDGLSTMALARDSLATLTGRGNVIHEFGHALGLQHEHQNPFRNFRFHKGKLEKYCYDTYGWSAKDCASEIGDLISEYGDQTTPFDSFSIMNYAISDRSVYAEIKGLPVLGGSELSVTDKIGIAKLYPGRVSEAKILQEDKVITAKRMKLGRCDILPARNAGSVFMNTQTCSKNSFIVKAPLGHGTSADNALGCSDNLYEALYIMENHPLCYRAQNRSAAD